MRYGEDGKARFIAIQFLDESRLDEFYELVLPYVNKGDLYAKWDMAYFIMNRITENSYENEVVKRENEEFAFGLLLELARNGHVGAINILGGLYEKELEEFSLVSPHAEIFDCWLDAEREQKLSVRKRMARKCHKLTMREEQKQMGSE